MEAFAEIDLTADLADALDARKFGFALLERAIGVVALARNIFQVLAQLFGGDGLGQRIVQGVGRCDARAHVADRYSHRRSAMAIAQREYGKKGVAGCSMVGMSERQGLAICSEHWNDEPAARVSARRHNCHSQKLPFRRG
ncbi:hypothetical protein ACVWXM_007802 [Bradyrhizobium sp. GM7.3]